MERVLGIGGVFFRAREPDTLRAWYAEHLGVELEDYGGITFWAEAGDVTVWAIFPATTEYFGAGERQAMINYRVSDLDAMLGQLRATGVNVEADVQEEEFGRFGWATDPEGNRFELWEPALRA